MERFNLALHSEALERFGLDLSHPLARDAETATDLLERKALDLILESATYEDYEWKADERGSEVSTVEAGALTEDQARGPEKDDKAEEKSAEDKGS